MDYSLYLNELIITLVKESGSDLHLTALHYPTIRVNGELFPLTKKEILKPEDVVGLLKELTDEASFNKFVINQELDFSYEHNGEYRLRGNAYFQKGNVGIALRLIPKIKDLTELSLPSQLSEFANQRQGFFLVVGPVGVGKSTTLASMIMEINKHSRKHIITIEDPIEYIFPQDKSIIEQRELGLDTSSFATALKSALRQDVDVLLIGEMRDAETMAAAVTAAETGHLVFSTLHTNSASQTIDRIIDSFPPHQQEQVRMQLASSLLGIFSQRLIPRISGGMIPAYELMVANTAIRNLIRDKRTHEIDMVIETGQQSGMIDFNRSLAELVRRGDISIESAMQYSHNPKMLERLI